MNAPLPPPHHALLPRAASWLNQEERSNPWALKLMVWISLTFGRAIGRVVLRGIALYFCVFSGAAGRASSAYLTRALGRPVRWVDRYRHIFSFASTVHDRVYLLNSQFERFDIEVVGAEPVYQAVQTHPGALVIGAHLGSFEAIRAVGRGKDGLRMTMMMYAENAQKISATLAAIDSQLTMDILPLGQIESMLAARDRLEAGHLVGMLADRSLGADACLSLPFLGEPAAFATGPWRMAALLKRPVFFMTGLYLGGNRYRVQFQPLADFTHTPRGERDAAIAVAIRGYADVLSAHCRQTPYNWFNFFDFWQTT